MKTIALCLNIPELTREENFRNLQIGRQYPGSGFLPHLARLCDSHKITLLAGKDVKPGKDVVILQEELNPEGLRLLQGGAIPKVVFCMESKLYAPLFYDFLPQVKELFQYQILFDGGTHRLYFPSFNLEDLKRINRPRGGRKPLCMISSNKQFWAMGVLNPALYSSPSWCEAVRNELHTERLRAIERNPHTDLYGRGWGNLSNIPPHWQFLIPQIKRMWKGEVEDKWEILEQYEEAFAYENTNLKGYVTEKRIDCAITDTDSIPYSLESFDLNNHSNEVFAQQVFHLLVGEE